MHVIKCPIHTFVHFHLIVIGQSAKWVQPRLNSSQSCNGHFPNLVITNSFFCRLFNLRNNIMQISSLICYKISITKGHDIIGQADLLCNCWSLFVTPLIVEVYDKWHNWATYIPYAHAQNYTIFQLF